MRFAQEAAQGVRVSAVDTEHLLLGILRETDNVANRILDRLGVRADRVCADVTSRLTRGDSDSDELIQLTPAAKRVIDLAYEEAMATDNNYIGTEHLLIGLMREQRGIAAQVLVSSGADLERTQAELRAMQDGHG